MLRACARSEHQAGRTSIRAAWSRAMQSATQSAGDQRHTGAFRGTQRQPEAARGTQKDSGGLPAMERLGSSLARSGFKTPLGFPLPRFPGHWSSGRLRV